MILHRNPQPSERVFLSPRAKSWTKGGAANALKILNGIIEEANIAKVDAAGRSIDIHALRGTACTRLLRHGVDVALASELMGHKDIRVTMKHYVSLRIEDTRKAIEKVPGLTVEDPHEGAPEDETCAESGSNLATGTDDTVAHEGRTEAEDTAALGQTR